MAGRFLIGPPPRFTRAAACTAPPRPPWEPALPRPRPPPRPPRWLRFSLMMSSKDISILSAMAGAESGLGSSPRVSTPQRHFLPLPLVFRRRGPAAAADWSRRARGRWTPAHCARGQREPLLRSRTRHGRFYTFPRGGNGRAGRLVIRRRRCEGEEWAGTPGPAPGGRKRRGGLGVAFRLLLRDPRGRGCCVGSEFGFVCSRTWFPFSKLVTVTLSF